ncbi:ABC transporter ATP-binding protein [Kutzneria viridogrisea]|uniref:ABC transport system ATP-binding protein n=2 Tax=Kutzneria TaxID=43356 RepID=W5W0U8_9PSEU|nr:ABC transporter ATP-binding protein [Kutzneria albida]AHH94141.1 ABC transport system ATP-binding protein [Kutzneria albida DSM 43870]MBA8929814.1 ABC-2 type transport system ATP-binding protein [Kutzneria viridogrisea]
MQQTDTVVRGAAVSLQGLVKHYGGVRAVDGVDLTIAPGEVVALLGPNGAGKSTTIDVLLGLSTPTSGAVTLFGRSPREAVSAGLVGAMLQSGGLLEDATVAETVGLFSAVYPKSLSAAEAMRRAGVAEFAKRRIGSLSGGQRQRVRFATALASDPDLLVLDEPTVAMDVEGRREFWAAMRAYASTGRTVLFATHYLAEAEDYADRVVLLRSGRVAADGSVAEIGARAAGRVISARVPGVSAAELSTVAGVVDVQSRGDAVELSCVDSDGALRELLARYPQAMDIEVRGAGLEAAFLALTSEGAAR